MSEAKEARRARRAEDVRLDVIWAAAECFAADGYDATTMRAIADRCGFTASSLYTYFDGKEEIFAALLEEMQAVLEEAFAYSMPGGMTFSQRLELLLMRCLEVVETHRDACVFMTGHSHQPDMHMLELLVRWIDQNSTKKERAGHVVDDVAFFVWGIMHGFFIQWMATGTEEPLGKKIPTIMSLITKGLSR